MIEFQNIVLKHYARRDSPEEVAKKTNVFIATINYYFRKFDEKAGDLERMEVAVKIYLEEANFNDAQIARTLDIHPGEVARIRNEILTLPDQKVKRERIIKHLKDLVYDYTTDREIADMFGVSTTLIYHLREEMGLKSSAELKRTRDINVIRPLVEDQDRVVSDQEVSEETGLPTHRISYLRREMGLNVQAQREERDRQIIKIFEMMSSPTDQKVADILDLDIETVKTVRKDNNIKLFRERYNKRLPKIIKFLLDKGFNDAEIAKETGLKRDKVTYIRQKLGLRSQRERRHFKERAKELYDMGFSNEQIEGFLHERFNFDHEVTPNLKEQIKFLRDRNYTDGKMAEFLDEEITAIKEVRESLGYKSYEEVKEEKEEIRSYKKMAEEVKELYRWGLTGKEIIDYMKLDTGVLDKIKKHYDVVQA